MAEPASVSRFTNAKRTLLSFLTTSGFQLNQSAKNLSRHMRSTCLAWHTHSHRAYAVNLFQMRSIAQHARRGTDCSKRMALSTTFVKPLVESLLRTRRDSGCFKRAGLEQTSRSASEARARQERSPCHICFPRLRRQPRTPSSWKRCPETFAPMAFKRAPASSRVMPLSTSDPVRTKVIPCKGLRHFLARRGVLHANPPMRSRRRMTSRLSLLAKNAPDTLRNDVADTVHFSKLLFGCFHQRSHGRKRRRKLLARGLADMANAQAKQHTGKADASWTPQSTQ